MNSVLRNLRPLLISLTVLILTAGIAFAAKPSNPGNGHGDGQTVTTRTETTDTETSETSETETETSETSETKTVDVTTTSTATTSETSNANCSVDPTTATPQVLAGLTHGQIVCWAAHQPTPPEYANHGAWVSHWAKGNHGAAGKSHHQ